jgi:hypothetical protein
MSDSVNYDLDGHVATITIVTGAGRANIHRIFGRA